MTKSIHVVVATGFFSLFAAISTPAIAQQQTGGAFTDSGDDGGGAGGVAGDATDAFQNVQRGDTVGSTANRGASFSDASGAGTSTGGGGQGGVGGIGGSPFGGFGGFGGLGGLFGNQQFGAANQATAPLVRTRIRSAIEITRPEPPEFQQTATGRLRSTPSSVRLGGVNVHFEGRTAVLTGIASTPREKRMSELLMRLEPGIRDVRNEIVIVPTIQ